jgi:tetratricopeptide (TPR) repeat protein
MWQTQERLLLPHIQSYLDMEVRKALWLGSEAIITPVLLKCGWVLLAMRQDSRLELLLREMFVELGQNPVKLSKECLPLYGLQSRSMYNLGKSREAVALLEQVVKIHKTTLAEDHPDRLASQHELGIAYQANGQVREAVALLEQVVKIEETTLAEDHPDRLASQHELGIAYQANGQVREARELLEQVVEIKQSKFQKDHPSRVVSEQLLAFWS